MFRLHIEFITQKGIMGNEHRLSRCQLVTAATELFLHSGSIEGALKMLRGKKICNFGYATFLPWCSESGNKGLLMYVFLFLQLMVGL